MKIYLFKSIILFSSSGISIVRSGDTLEPPVFPSGISPTKDLTPPTSKRGICPTISLLFFYSDTKLQHLPMYQRVLAGIGLAKNMCTFKMIPTRLVIF